MFSDRELAPTFHWSTFRGVEFRVCAKNKGLVFPNRDGGTVGRVDPPGNVSVGLSGGKCFAQIPT